MMRHGVILIGVISSLLSPASAGESLLTSFVNVSIGTVPLATPVLVRDARGRGLWVRNDSATAQDLRFQVLLEPGAPARDGALPIPDVTWVIVEPPAAHLEPGDSIEARVVLRVPKHSAYRNKRFFATILIETAPQATQAKGVVLRGAIKTRFRFQTAS